MLSASKILRQIHNQERSAEAVAKDVLMQVDQRDKEINAYISLNNQFLEQARSVDRKIKSGKKLGRLEGLPLAIKDNICTKMLTTTAASALLEKYRSPFNATAAQRLFDEGALLIGKTNMDEFGMGSSNETSFFGPCKNPVNVLFSPGGSSGGSAAAVSSGMAACALGSDTGGSIRQPAHFCGLVGLKPTYGRVSRYGLIAFSSSLDQIGPITSTVEDAELLFSAMSGPDPMDLTTTSALSPTPIKKDSLRFGWVSSMLDQVDPEVAQRFHQLRQDLENQGHVVVEVELPHLEHCVATYYIIACSEASSNLSRFDGVRFGHRAEPADNLEDLYAQTRKSFGKEVKRRLLLGGFSLSEGSYEAFFLQASKVRRAIQNDFSMAFESCDALMTPVTNSTAFPLKQSEETLVRYEGDYWTIGANLSGIPALTVPLSKNSHGMPFGVQLLANSFQESILFDSGKLVEDFNDN